MKPAAGFTLLELLIALSLMGLVLVMVYSALWLGIRSWDAGDERATQLNDMRLVQGFLRRNLRQSQTVFRIDEDAQRVVVFEGAVQHMTFVAPLLTHLGLGGLYLIELDLVDVEGIGQLRIRWQPYRPDTLEDNRVHEDDSEATLLLSEVADVQWSYFGVEEDGDEPDWHERWVNTQERPRLVNLRLTWRDEPWPDLVVELSN
jgi:general secretion pathway protein J